MADSLRDLLRVHSTLESVTLAGFLTDATPLVAGKDEAKSELDRLGEKLFEQHELLFANSERSVLLVLQGTDASGKNGTIKHVIGRVNPAGVRISSFGEPTAEEESHHFLWRIRKEVPPAGFLGVFNRSHYEDVLVPIAQASEPAEVIDRRIDEIIEFEQELSESGVVVVKCLLNISYEEQRRRFLRRLRRTDKRWKFNPADLETRQRWDEYQAAYGQVLSRTSTEEQPWYVIPSDNKWYRNWAVATILIETLDELEMDYPEPEFDIARFEAALEPPS